MSSLVATSLLCPSSSSFLRRRWGLLLLGTALLSVMPAGSSDNQGSIFTGGYLNCRGWRASSTLEKNSWMLGFGEGFNEGMVSFSIDGGKNPPEEPIYNRIRSGYFGAAKLTHGEQSQAMDALCAPPENSLIEVNDLVRIVGMKADGSTPAEIDGVIRLFRSQAASQK
jgi:hypothetical protein